MFMLSRALLLPLFAFSLLSQTLDEAYSAMRSRQFDSARALFEKGLAEQPDKVSARVDYAYLLLKTGESIKGREQIRQALEVEPERETLWLEFAFLCYETGLRAEAFEVFLRLKLAKDAGVQKTATETFARLDAELSTSIARWREAAVKNPDSYSVHEELARLLEERNDWVAAAEEYRIAFGLKPDKRKFLLDIAKVEREALRVDYANAALLAASRGGQPYVAQMARERMTTRYPYVYEFEYAIQMDPLNVSLRREYGFLLLAMNREKDAMKAFEELLRLAPDDTLANAQLAFLKSARNDMAGARPLLAKVAAQGESSLSAARELAEKSLEKGYLKDALLYLNQIREASPNDFATMLRLGWAHNMLKDDKEAIRWFEMARHSPDAKIAKEAEQAYQNLRPSLAPFRTTSWVLPFYSSRWKEVFTYGQTKMEFRLPGTALRPYLSSRFIGDLGRNRQSTAGQMLPQSLSESAVVAAVGLATPRQHGWMAWGEAGSAWQYFGKSMKPDYRGGVNFARNMGAGNYWATTFDGVFLSRFDNNALFTWQNRVGQNTADKALRLYWNFNLTVDAKRQDWANFVETGPGLRFRLEGMPQGLYFSVDYLAGWHLMKTAPGRDQKFRDLRAGLWYAFTR